jgi:histone deacetylase 6
MTYMLSTLAGGKVVVALEVSLSMKRCSFEILYLWPQGGYTLESLSDCALAVGRMLLGEAPPELPPLVSSEVEAETIWLVAKEQSKYWKSINIKACEPKEGSYPFVYEYFLLKLISVLQTLKSSHSLFPVRYLRELSYWF